MYKTKQKQAILDLFKENNTLTFNAHEIINKLINFTSKATIYRQLDKLCNDGIINKFYNEKENIYEYQYVNKTHDCHQHLHLKCNKCGKIIHLQNNIINEINFKIDYSHSLIYGTCNDCL